MPESVSALQETSNPPDFKFQFAGFVGNLSESAFLVKNILTLMAIIDIIVNARGMTEPKVRILIADRMKRGK